MLDDNLRHQITELIRREVIPAVGCTEPAAVALCTARATEMLGCRPEHIDVILSPNMLKNAMGVGIPGTGRVGLPIAVALGATVGRSELGLEVLRDVTPQAVADALPLAEAVAVELCPEPCDKLYVAVTVHAAGQAATAMIAGGHTTFVDPATYKFTPNSPSSPLPDSATPQLSLPLVWEYAMTSPLDELRFILESRRLNKAAAEQAFTERYGHSVGRTLHCQRQRAIMGDSIFSRILSYTSAACDARMAGACIPVMSNSGSGNQGIAATLPVAVYAEETFASEEQTIRALTLSHLTVIYIKQSLGRLSALCGCVVAATGSSCGIAYLMGGDYSRIAATVKNMIANLTGMICDGAKPSCAMKLTSGVATAVISAMCAMEGHEVSAVEGIIDSDVDRSIANLTAIGRDAMNETDRLILSIMTSK